MDASQLRARIEAAFPGSYVEVRDLTGGGDHFEALVVSDQFEGRSLVERHQLVYQALGDAMRESIHALTLKTLTFAQYKNRTDRR